MIAKIGLTIFTLVMVVIMSISAIPPMEKWWLQVTVAVVWFAAGCYVTVVWARL